MQFGRFEAVHDPAVFHDVEPVRQRQREPEMFGKYRAPLVRALPATVVLLSGFAIYVYSGIDVKVVPLTAFLYAAGLSYYWFWAHPRIQTAAPEELSARQARSTSERSP